MSTTAVGPGLSVRDIRASRPQLLLEVSRRLEQRRCRLVVLAELVLWRRSAAPRWTGAGSGAAADRYGTVVAGLGQLASSIAVAANAVAHAAQRLQSALELVGRADHRASDEGAWVDADGRLFLPVRSSLGDPVGESHRARLDDLLKAEVHACLQQARRAATRTDEDLHRALLAAARGATSLAAAGSTARPAAESTTDSDLEGSDLTVPPQASAGVFASAAWWRSLTDEERHQALRERPEWVGPRDGVPAAARHEANLVLLDRAERTATARAREAQRQASPWNAAERTRAQEQLDGIRAVRDVLARRDGAPRKLLLLDAREPDLKAVVAVGDVDRAEHVVTFVGGLSTMVGADLGRYDDTFVRMRSETRAIAEGEDVAVVTWIGYDAPQVHEITSSIDRNVLNGKLARENAGALADFVTGLEAARDGPAHQTVWAHSYGATLAGFASLRTSSIDDVVVFGAPGLPFTDIAQTALKPGALNVLGAVGDDVFSYGWMVHGTRPSEVDGSLRLSTFALKDPGSGCNHWMRPRAAFVDAGRTSTGHSDYLRAGTDSAHNLVAVAAGRPELRIVQGADERACTTTGPSLGSDPLRWPRLVP
ncbi:alpha/beta hydrolase [Terrabacter sp. 2RAF25]|uniref:alpha/beta hydrolase n=1 Tax=Terrabacter sp. 2RAF25 TaxID=3232998 RepID=UPI003F965580